MSFERFLPPNPEHHTEAVAGMARALADAPHDAGYHGVMADALSDAGAEPEAVAHRIAANPDRARDLMHDSPDLHATGLHLTKLAHAISLHAATATASIPPHVQFGTPHEHADQRASGLLGDSQYAGDLLARAPHRSDMVEQYHALTSGRHESLANYHEARSYEPNGSAPRWQHIRDGHEIAGAVHRAAQSTHIAAGEVHREIQDRDWRASRGVE